MNSKAMRQLFNAIAKLKTSAEVKALLRDVCTLSELTAMSERFEVAKRVNKGESYRLITEKVNTSTATVTRVAHWLHHGMGGYKMVLNRMKK